MQLFKSVFSTVEINFKPKTASSVTSTEIDKEVKNSIASSENLATEIQQLFIDIKASDAIELNDWVNSHEGEVPPPEVKNKRMNRFNNAFSFIFGNMYVEKTINSNFSIYSETRNISSNSKIVYELYKNNTKIENAINVINNYVSANNINTQISFRKKIDPGVYSLVQKYGEINVQTTLNIENILLGMFRY